MLFQSQQNSHLVSLFRHQLWFRWCPACVIPFSEYFLVYLGCCGVCKRKQSLQINTLKKMPNMLLWRCKASSPGNLKSNRGPFSVHCHHPELLSWTLESIQGKWLSLCLNGSQKKKEECANIHFQMIAASSCSRAKQPHTVFRKQPSPLNSLRPCSTTADSEGWYILKEEKMPWGKLKTAMDKYLFIQGSH